jgi:hypothetical protein
MTWNCRLFYKVVSKCAAPKMPIGFGRKYEFLNGIKLEGKIRI